MATEVSYKAVPVIRNIGRDSGMAIAPAVMINDAPVQSLGAVDFRKPLASPSKGVPNDVTIVFENTDDTDPATFIFGDANGLIAAILGATYSKPSAPASSIEAVVASMGKNPRSYKSLNYRITTGNSGQFSNKFQYAKADEDGSVFISPLNIQSAQRNTQMNDKILTLAQEIFMDDTTGIILQVAPLTRVEIDFSFREIYRPGADL